MAWSDLPKDLLHCIASQLHVVDFLRFSFVCTSWNAALAHDNEALLRTRCPPSPWLLLPSNVGEASDTLTFRDLTVEEGGVGCNRRFSYLSSQIFGRRCFGSKDGWLVTVDKMNLKPLLFNPLTKAELSLPSLFTIPEDKRQSIPPRYAPDGSIDCFYDDRPESVHHFRDVFFDKIVLSSNNQFGTAVVIYGYFQLLALARPGDESWVPQQLPPFPTNQRGEIEDVYYHEIEQRFYAITCESAVFAFDLNGQNVKLICPSMLKPMTKYHKIYIAFLSETLLKIERWIECNYVEIDKAYTIKTTKISVFKLVSVDVDSCSFSEWILVKDLMGYSFFIGYNQTLLLHHTTAPGIKPNCIYFADHWCDKSPKDDNRDAGFFDLHNNCFQYFFGSDSRSSWPPLIWFTPSLS